MVRRKMSTRPKPQATRARAPSVSSYYSEEEEENEDSGLEDRVHRLALASRQQPAQCRQPTKQTMAKIVQDNMCMEEKKKATSDRKTEDTKCKDVGYKSKVAKSASSNNVGGMGKEQNSSTSPMMLLVQ